jgi:hypothetical protein
MDTLIKTTFTGLAIIFAVIATLSILVLIFSPVVLDYLVAISMLLIVSWYLGLSRQSKFIKNMKTLDPNISTEDIRKALGNKGRL